MGQRFQPGHDAWRYRRGECISTAVVESMVNRVIERRMTKNQPLRWSRRGAHLPVQIRLTLPAVVESVSRPLTP
jgi:hypothetical protein